MKCRSQLSTGDLLLARGAVPHRADMLFTLDAVVQVALVLHLVQELVGVCHGVRSLAVGFSHEK